MPAVVNLDLGFASDAFALGCALSSAYGFLSGAWPFGVEIIWCGIALRRYQNLRRSQTGVR